MDLLFGKIGGVLEMRAANDGGVRLSGRFPYNSRAVLSDGGRNGRPEKEEFAEHAFEYRVNDPAADIHLLSGHRYDRPLASKLAGTLSLQDRADALTFDALITAEVAGTSHARDALALLAAGLATGISPGFRMPPERAVPKQEAEEWLDEDCDPEQDMHRARIRRVKQALLFEVSIVTQPAYPEAQVTTRAKPIPIVRPSRQETLRRWRY